MAKNFAGHDPHDEKVRTHQLTEKDALDLQALVSDLEQLDQCKLDALSFLTLDLLTRTVGRFYWHLEAATERALHDLASRKEDTGMIATVDLPLKKSDPSVS